MTEEQLKRLSALLDEKIHPLQTQLDSQGDLLTQLVKMASEQESVLNKFKNL
ncbi:hypothetical protein B0G52_1013 [Cohnella sp. SGD-V74]|uniref:hypothetical protein n=1 Tax=unclassified Cohnella TaxID=2636738 RepID=UPI000D489F43|nr:MULTISPECIES: hypothetical protein [unclassified Cohnella]PRX74520.1 hypothetical protein B0G52_1013 [Cohnella sp. SGD-V74]